MQSVAIGTLPPRHEEAVPSGSVPAESKLSGEEARRLALRAQGLLGSATRPRNPSALLRSVSALQLDTISVLARSHELVCYARLGPVGRVAVEDACWGTDRAGRPVGFEFWAHAACVLPIESWPWFAFRRRYNQVRTKWWHATTPDMLAEIRRRLGAGGPMTASELGGAKGKGQWWDWSPLKVAVERLLARGEVVCTTRRGWKRVYDLAERAIPSDLYQVEPDDAACLRHLVADAGRCLGVGTAADLAGYFRLGRKVVESAVGDTGLVPVRVDGWAAPAWADPEGLAALPARGRRRTTLLSPFDSLVWDRARTERLFDFTHRLEAYTPAGKRLHGYYAMPLLAGGRLIGRVDPARRGTTLVARQISLAEPVGEDALAAMAVGLRQAAAWVDCTAAVVEQASPDWIGPAVSRVIG
jgi:uncharacterized protein YcaQ